MSAATAPVTPSMPESAVVEKVKGDRLLVGKDREKHQRLKPYSPDSSTAKDTNSPVSKISIKVDLRPLMQEGHSRLARDSNHPMKLHTITFDRILS